jgi:hypothetical protein
MEGEILNLQILQRPSLINSPEQTLRMLSPAAATDPQRTPPLHVAASSDHALLGINMANLLRGVLLSSG